MCCVCWTSGVIVFTLVATLWNTTVTPQSDPEFPLTNLLSTSFCLSLWSMSTFCAIPVPSFRFPFTPADIPFVSFVLLLSLLTYTDPLCLWITPVFRLITFFFPFAGFLKLVSFFFVQFSSSIWKIYFVSHCTDAPWSALFPAFCLISIFQSPYYLDFALVIFP